MNERDDYAVVVDRLSRHFEDRHTRIAVANAVLTEWVRHRAGQAPRLRQVAELAAHRRLVSLPRTVH